jgi:hypothetical protein
MSRVLNRPMFRMGGSIGGTDRQKHFGMAMGGSTSGITSGLEPKRGRVDGPGGYAGIDYDKAFETSQKITDKYYPRRGGDINRFLIEWGLNMAGNPPSGNVLQTAAKQAQVPTERLFASMDQSDATRSAVGAGLFGEIIGAEGKMMGEGKVYKDQVMLDALLNATKEKIRITKALEEEGLEATAIENLKNELTIAETTINQIKKRDPLVDKFLGSTVVVKELLDVILPSYDKMMIQDEESGENVLKYPKTPEGQERKIQDAMQEIIRIIQSGASVTMAKGGRAGYQQGMLVTPEGGWEKPSAEEAVTQQQIDSMGQAPEVDAVGMSFEELRARLPATITDDIVILLSQSGQALEDFATIQTQQDVDNFNTKYNVNLILPSEG